MAQNRRFRPNSFKYVFAGYENKSSDGYRKNPQVSRAPRVILHSEAALGQPLYVDDVYIDINHKMRFDGTTLDLGTTLVFNKESTVLMPSPLTYLSHLTTHARSVEVEIPFYDAEFQQKLDGEEAVCDCLARCPDLQSPCADPVRSAMTPVSQVVIPSSATVVVAFYTGEVCEVSFKVYDCCHIFRPTAGRVPTRENFAWMFLSLMSTGTSFCVKFQKRIEEMENIVQGVEQEMPLGWIANYHKAPNIVTFRGPWRSRYLCKRIVRDVFIMSGQISDFCSPNFVYLVSYQAELAGFQMMRTSSSIGTLVVKHVNWDYKLTWHAQHAFALGACIALASIQLPAYVMLWIFEHTPKMLHAPHHALIALIQRCWDFNVKRFELKSKRALSVKSKN